MKNNAENDKQPLAPIVDVGWIKAILKSIHDAETVKGREGYSLDKESISAVFRNSQGGSLEGELARLAMIDGMYSTQMNRRYYALEELAGMIVELRKELVNNYGKTLEDAFVDFAEQMDFRDEEERNLFIQKHFVVRGRNLWSASYGIGKHLDEKGVAISLVSKYAYFATGFKFPIYDTIACEVIPLLEKNLGRAKHKTPLKVSKAGSQKTDGQATMKAFIAAINSLKKEFDCKSYDVFDRLLWYTGKMLRGNLSLILSRKEYSTWFGKVPPPRDDKAFNHSIETISTDQFMTCLDSERPRESRAMLKNLYNLARALRGH